MTTETPKVKRTRASRKNYQQIVEDLRTYVEISAAIMESLPTGDLPVDRDFLKGQICAFKAVLERLEGK